MMAQRKNSQNLVAVNSIKTNQVSSPSPNHTKYKSPFSNSKSSHQTAQKQNVSYGELQIVL